MVRQYFHADHVSVLDLVRLAYRGEWPMRPRPQVFKPDTWLDTDRFNVTASGAANMTDDDLAAALRPVLEDRFGVAVHEETRTIPVYALVLKKAGKIGRHLRPAATPCADVAPFELALSYVRRCAERFGAPSIILPPQAPPQRLLLAGVTMNQFAWTLTSVLRGDVAIYVESPSPPVTVRRPAAVFLDSQLVVNQTGLSGRYDVDVEYTAVPPVATPNFTSTRDVHAGSALAPPPEDISLFQALDEQLGLKVALRTIPVPMLKIDAASFPVLN